MTDVLCAEEHFESLREAVWVRFCARHRGRDRDHFEDLYAEWWTREVERAAKGSPSRAAAPAAFVAEAVHRVFIDDTRARARGLARDDKGALEVVDLDAQLDAAAGSDTAGQAGYEALAHRVLTLVRGRLSERELRVFVWSYLYLQPTEKTADALGLSLPRVKKDRKRVAGKIGEEVWQVLNGELDLCAAYEEKSLAAIFEILTVHVEDCPTCATALGGMRKGALAVVGPEALVLGTATEGATHVLSDLAHSVAVRVHGMLHRGAEAMTAVPPSGRTAAAVAVAATVVAGGAAQVAPVRHDKRQPVAERRQAEQPAAPRARPSGPAQPPPVAAPGEIRPTPAKQRAVPDRTRSGRRKEGAAAKSPRRDRIVAPSRTAGREDPAAFEQQAPAPAPSSAPPPTPTAAAASQPQPATPAPKPAREFGFEHD